MDAAALETRLREDRLDDTMEPYLWSQDTLFRHLNDAVSQACRRARLLVDARTAATCTIAITAGTALYALHPSVLAIKSAQLDLATEPLGLTTVKRRHRTRPGWLTDTARDEPAVAVVDYSDGYIRLDPIPAEADTLRLVVWRMPLDAELIEAGGDDPAIPEHMHEDLLDWVEHRCYSLADAETRDPQRAADAYTRFEAKFGQLPTHHAVRLWGVSPIRGTRAEYL